MILDHMTVRLCKSCIMCFQLCGNRFWEESQNSVMIRGSQMFGLIVYIALYLITEHQKLCQFIDWSSTQVRHNYKFVSLDKKQSDHQHANLLIYKFLRFTNAIS